MNKWNKVTVGLTLPITFIPPPSKFIVFWKCRPVVMHGHVRYSNIKCPQERTKLWLSKGAADINTCLTWWFDPWNNSLKTWNIWRSFSRISIESIIGACAIASDPLSWHLVETKYSQLSARPSITEQFQLNSYRPVTLAWSFRFHL